MNPMQSQVKIVKGIALQENRANIPAEASSERDFWMSMRQALLQQLAVIEKKLGISRRCRHCGNDLSTKLS